MVTKAFLDGIIHKFEYCKDIDINWNIRLFEKSDGEAWSNILIERSKDLRNSFTIFEDTIKTIKNIFVNELTDDEYKLVADAALKIYTDGYDDYYVLSLLIIPCIEHFKEINDLNYLLPLIHAYCYENEQFYNGVLTDNEYSYDDIVKYKNEYLNITNKYARLTLLKSISNKLTYMLNDSNVSFIDIYKLSNDTYKMWKSPKVQKLDGDDEEFIYFANRIKDSIFSYENLKSLSLDEQDVYEKLLKTKVERTKNVKGYNVYLEQYNSLLYTTNKIDHTEFINRCLDSFDKAFIMLEKSNDENEQEDLLGNCFNIIDSISHAVVNIENQEYSLIKERINKLREYVKSIPYSFYNTEMNRFFFELYKRTHIFMTYEEKKEYLIEVVMFRQPITCIHSIMVLNIVKTIVLGLFKNKKQMFIGLLGCKTEEDVEKKKDEILDFALGAALFHDVGKVATTHVINTQNRRLASMEFDLIKQHPSNGPKVLDYDPDFKPFFDIMLGHHKFYDGSLGYPDDFDNTKSKVRLIIDLVSIADSMDAATDILGRNYNKGKSFEILILELAAGRNKRYNPEIVDFIVKDKDTYKALRTLTSDGRFEIYEYVYTRFIK